MGGGIGYSAANVWKMNEGPLHRIASLGWNWKLLLIGGLLLAGSIGLFWPATGYDFIDFDDGGYVADNVQVSTGLPWENIRWAFTTVHESWWLPVLWLSFMLDTELFGTGPFGYHLTNILLFGLNVVLLFWVLYRMTGACWRSALVAALFAVHPLRVESVVWITERKDVLSGLFWMLAMLAHVRYVERPSRLRYALVPIWMLLGLLSKAILIALPPVLLLMDYWPLRRAGPPWQRAQWGAWGKLLAEKWPLVVLAAVFVGINLATHESGRGSLSGMSGVDRLALIPPNYWAYLGKIVWPVRLALLYPEQDLVRWPLALAALAGLGGLTAAGIRLAPRRPYLLAGWLWFLVVMFPMIRGVRMGLAELADRFTYLPSIGLAMALAWLAGEWAERSRAARRGLTAVALAALALLGGLTVRQMAYWKDSETLFQRTLELTGRNPIMSNNLGAFLLDRGEHEEAAALFRESLLDDPDYALPNFNMGAAMFAMKNYVDSLDYFRTALRLDPDYVATYIRVGHVLLTLGQGADALPYFRQALEKDPKASVAQYSMGNAYYELGDYEKALEYYRATVKMAPKYADGHYNQGNALSRLRRFGEAEDSYRRALALKTNHFAAWHNLGNVLLAEGRPQDALNSLREAVRVAPTHAAAHFDLSRALEAAGRAAEAAGVLDEALRLDPGLASNLVHQADRWTLNGRYPEAVAKYREALRIRPEDSLVHGNLANALSAMGRQAEALEHYQEALRLDPGYVPAHFNMGNALVELGRFGEAIRKYEAARQLDPDHAAAGINQGRALCALGRLEEAVDLFQSVWTRHPDHLPAAINLENVLFDLGRTEEAARLAGRAMDLAREQGDAQAVARTAERLGTLRSGRGP